MAFKEVFDISILLGKEDVCYPGDVPFSRQVVSSIERGAAYNLSNLTLPSHSGTHIDAPAHFIKGAKTIDLYPLKRFIIPAHVVDAEDEEAIEAQIFQNLDIKSGDALLFKTMNSMSGLSTSGSFSEKFVYMSEEAAHRCADLNVGLVGIDYLSVDRCSDEAAPAHRILLESDIMILENINLREVPEGEYTLFCPPLKIRDAEASPVRAMLLR
jgi:arylformamidase